MTRPFTNRYLIGVYCGVVVILSLIWWRFTNIENMLGNHGLIHTSLDVILSWVTIFTLPLLGVGYLYKSLLFGRSHGPKGSLSPGIGGIISVILSGSTCCGVTLASSVGLVPLMSFLPGSGIEVKLLATILLVIGTMRYYETLETCSLTSLKRKGKKTSGLL